jgi:hypothetical protein
MSTQYRLVQSGKTASGSCSAGQGSSEPVAPRIFFFFFVIPMVPLCNVVQNKVIGDVGIVSSFSCVDENLSDVESGDNDGNDNRIIKNVVTKKKGVMANENLTSGCPTVVHMMSITNVICCCVRNV